MTETRQEKAFRLQADGYTTGQIADIMNVTEKQVQSMVWKERKKLTGAGRLPQTREDSLIAPMEDDVKAWLYEITPEGVSVSETIRSIIVDAYDDEHA